MSKTDNLQINYIPNKQRVYLSLIRNTIYSEIQRNEQNKHKNQRENLNQQTESLTMPLIQSAATLNINPYNPITENKNKNLHNITE